MKRFLTVFGYALCIFPPALAVLEYFPLWVESGEKRVSAVALILLAVCFTPALRAFRRYVKAPSALLFWLLLFLFISAFRAVMDELLAISLIALFTAIPGTACLYFAKRIPDKK